MSFCFDLASPWTYLAAERVDRLFSGVRWRPTPAEALAGGLAADSIATEPTREAVAARAAALRLPLVWPERWPVGGRSAMRVASLAAEHNAGAAFVLAASRLAFCGGYDLDDPEILAEAAAAAGLGLDETLAAAADLGRDGAMEQTALRLVSQGADRLPVVRVGRSLYCGEHRLADAAAAAAAPTEMRSAAVD